MYGTVWYQVKGRLMVTRSTRKQPMEAPDEISARQRILDAAFAAFKEGGYAETSTLEMGARARVSKRELYVLVGRKKEMLVAFSGDRARRLRPPADLPEPRDRDSLARALAAFGTQLLRETSDP